MMKNLLFPNATYALLTVINEHRDNPVQAVDEYLQQFGINCAQKFLTSLTSVPELFPGDELLERMKEVERLRATGLVALWLGAAIVFVVIVMGLLYLGLSQIQ